MVGLSPERYVPNRERCVSVRTMGTDTAWHTVSHERTRIILIRVTTTMYFFVQRLPGVAEGCWRRMRRPIGRLPLEVGLAGEYTGSTNDVGSVAVLSALRTQ